jgi:predicted phosphodiesterase
MPATTLSDEEFISVWRRLGGARAVAAELGMTERAAHRRRRMVEKKNAVVLTSQGRPDLPGTQWAMRPGEDSTMRVRLDDGVIIVGSDCHYWPGPVTTAHRGMVRLIDKLKPHYVVLNGDLFDGATNSRYSRIGWQQRPTVKQELETVQDRLADIEAVAGNARCIRTLGNHDLRFDSLLASQAPEYEGVFGMALSDHLPRWKACWAMNVNDHTVIKHRIKNGIHATWGNTSDAQINTITGHLHNLRVTPRTTMSPLNGGVLYGVDTGTMADIWGPQFGYLEDGPRNWRSGFAVLTFMHSYLMPPELAQVVQEGLLYFRGKLWEV